MSADRAPAPRAPTGLGTRGRSFWRQTVAVFELSDVELELLREACRTLDECDQLAAAVKRDGITVMGSAGQPRAHPALAEVRQARAALGRLLSQLELPDADGSSLPSVQTAKARRAADARWRPHRIAKGAGRG